MGPGRQPAKVFFFYVYRQHKTYPIGVKPYADLKADLLSAYVHLCMDLWIDVNVRVAHVKIPNR